VSVCEQIYITFWGPIEISYFVCVYVCVYRFIRHNGEITYIVCVCLSVHVHVCVCAYCLKIFETLNGTVWMQQLKVRGHCEEIIKENKKNVCPCNIMR